MITADYVVVGAGLTGSTIARTLHDAGRQVVVLDRRPFLGGNCADTTHTESGIRYNLFGPHYFRTNSERIWEWVQRFDRFYPWAAEVETMVRGLPYRWPLKSFHQTLRETVVVGYNRKMWGDRVVPDEVVRRSTEIQSQVGHKDDDPRLKTDKFQGIPAGGYTGWIEKILENIPRFLCVDYLRNKEDIHAKVKLIYTGPIDEFYKYRFGPLDYRGQQRELVWKETRCRLQNTIQRNFPEKIYPFLRRIEWNHLAKNPTWSNGSLITYEVPFSPKPEQSQYKEYPVNDAGNKAKLREYQITAACDNDWVVFCGRMGTYSYIDMDQAIASGLKVAEKLLKEKP